MAEDVSVTVVINAREAASGTTRSLPLPGGQQATVNIPADAYEGQVLWFPGYVRENEHDTQPGTLFLTVQVAAEQLNGAEESALAPVVQATPLVPPPPHQLGPVPSTPAGRSQRQRINNRAVLALAVLLVIVSSGATFVFVHITRSTAQANNGFSVTTATSHNSDATATRIVQGTLTASTATATVQAQATAAVVAANPDPYANGKLIVYDQLDGTEDDTTRYLWTGTKGCTFNGGALHALDDDPQHLKDCQVPGTLTNRDFTLEVNATILKGDTAQIFFRGDALLSLGYFFSIDTTGSYVLTRLGSETFTPTGYTILQQGTSQAIKQGYNQSNLLALVAQGNTFTIYANGQKIASASDNNFDHGEIGLVASSYANDTSSTEATFTKLRIWQIGD